MKKIIILFILLSAKCIAQDSRDSALVNIDSEGFLVNLQSGNFSNNINNFPIGLDRRHTEIQLSMNSLGWKFSKDLNLAGIIELNG